MTRPLKINNSTPVSVKEMSNAEMDYSAHQILVNFTSSNTGTGTVNVSSNSAYGTSIGSFVDTSRPDTIGSHPVGTTINSATYTFRQNLTAVSENPTRPVKFLTDGAREQSDADIESHIVSRALGRLIGGGLGSYRLQPSAPTTGGTWVAIATITNTYQNAQSNTTKLWRRTAETTPTTVRPIKKRTDHHLQEMSDGDIQTLTNTFRNQIVNTGVGQYRIQTSAPATGTWIRVGSAFTDTRQNLGFVNYAGNYTGSYTGFFTGTYSRNFAGTYSRNFAGNYNLVYGTRVAGTYTGYYTGYFTGYYTGFFSGTYSQNFAGTYTGYYAGRTVLNTSQNVSTVSLWIRTA